MKHDIGTTKGITRAALFGAAVGDALGVPVEFLSRKEVRDINPTEMLGCDTPRTFGSRWGGIIPAGAWSDDTSMAVATMASIAMNNGNIYFNDVMEQFCAWWGNGKYTSLDSPFGLGGVVSEALRNFTHGIPAINCGPTEFTDNGNGALMRIFPFSLYCIFHDLDTVTTVELINNASGITHGHEISKMGCLFFTLYMKALIDGQDCKTAWETARAFDYGRWYSSNAIDAYKNLLSPEFINMGDDIIAENGYVVTTLTAAIYSMLHGNDYESSVLCAISMGYDTDTNAAVTGALAGVYYGFNSIPKRWLDKLLNKTSLIYWTNQFANACK